VIWIPDDKMKKPGLAIQPLQVQATGTTGDSTDALRLAQIEAGDFDDWLQRILQSFRTASAMEVPCGDCRGCCSAGRFVHLVPSDQQARAAISRDFLQHAPGMPSGHAVVGYLADGLCPMLKHGTCTIYPYRPSTCRTFDCRVLAAAGLQVVGKWNERINARVQAWRFTFSSSDSWARFNAIRRAADFIGHNAAAFPGGRAPSEPATIAVLAIKVHPVLMGTNRHAKPSDVANAIVAASRRFEETC